MSPDPFPKSPMAKPHSSTRSLHPSILADGLLFSGGAAVALLLFYVLYSFLSPSIPMPSFPTNPSATQIPPSSPTFYDDPTLSYTIHSPISDWDEKRRHWLRLHPTLASGEPKILMVTGSQSTPCRNPLGDHLLLKFFKNKVDYCRIHNIPIFYNTVLLEPRMFTYWAKMPVIRAAMVAHPESEWIWWVDSDAAITDMDFKLPFHRYRHHNLVLHGWPNLVHNERSWTSLNAGVFLIRNCQWSLDFMDVWSRFGPQSPEYEQWGKTLRATLPDKTFPESDDQSALVYLLLKDKDRWGDKIYLENKYYFEGYWLEIVGKLKEVSDRHLEMERRSPELRRRRAEAEAEAAAHGRRRVAEGRPFITHFTGCQPCSGDHNNKYSGENCYEGMQRALNFADDQVLRFYGFRHAELNSTSDVRPTPFDFPAAGDGR